MLELTIAVAIEAAVAAGCAALIVLMMQAASVWQDSVDRAGAIELLVDRLSRDVATSASMQLEGDKIVVDRLDGTTVQYLVEGDHVIRDGRLIAPLVPGGKVAWLEHPPTLVLVSGDDSLQFVRTPRLGWTPACDNC